MTVGVVEKRKVNRTCADCGETDLPATVEKCACGSTEIKKSIIIVRKEEADAGEELPSETDENTDDEDLEDEEVEEDDDEENEEEEEAPVTKKAKKKSAPVMDNEDQADSGEDDDEDEDDPDGDGDDDTTAAGDTDHDFFTTSGKKRKSPLKKSLVPVMSIEALGLTTQLAEGIAKAVTGKDAANKYEELMTEFNTVMDAAAERWLSGSTVTKAKNRDSQISVIKRHIDNVVKAATEGKVMPKATRPKALDELELPEEVVSYISSLEGEGVEKRDDIYKGLTPEAANIVKRSEALIEENEVAKWDGIAKSYKHFPGNKAELAVTLRSLSESNPTAFETLKKTLDAAEYNLSQSNLFKSFGQPGGGEPTDEVTKRRNAAQEMVSKGEYKTIEQAEVALMEQNKAGHYRATNAQ